MLRDLADPEGSGGRVSVVAYSALAPAVPNTRAHPGALTPIPTSRSIEAAKREPSYALGAENRATQHLGQSPARAFD